MNNSNCVLFYLFQFTVICAASIVIIILVSPLFSTLLSSINCHCNQFLQHQPFVVIHLRPELPEYYFGSYNRHEISSEQGRSAFSYRDDNLPQQIYTQCIQSPGTLEIVNKERHSLQVD